MKTVVRAKWFEDRWQVLPVVDVELLRGELKRPRETSLTVPETTEAQAEYFAREARMRSGPIYSVEPLEKELKKSIEWLLNKHGKALHTSGLGAITMSIERSSLRDTAPTICELIPDHVDISISDSTFGAGMLLCPSSGVPPLGAALVRLLKILHDDPYASDKSLVEKLGALRDSSGRQLFRDARRELVAGLRTAAGIPVAPLRPGPRELLSSSVARMVPEGWLRKMLDSTLGVTLIRDLAPPWPVWWRLEQEADIAKDGALVESGGLLVRVEKEEFDRAEELWKKHMELFESAGGETSLREAYADLIAATVTRPPHDHGNLKHILRVAAVTGRWPAYIQSSRRPLEAGEVIDMLRLCDPADWDVVLDRVNQRGIATVLEGDQTDVLIELLAQAAGDGVVAARSSRAQSSEQVSSAS